MDIWKWQPQAPSIIGSWNRRNEAQNDNLDCSISTVNTVYSMDPPKYEDIMQSPAVDCALPSYEDVVRHQEDHGRISLHFGEAVVDMHTGGAVV